MNRSTPGLPVHHQLPEFSETHVHWVGDAIQPSHPLSSPSPLPPIPPSIRVFSNGLILHMRWPQYWSFSCNISPSNEHPGLISFRMDCLDLLAVQGTLKSLLRHHSSKASILQCSVFFIVQLSHPYMTTGKTTALTRRTFVGIDEITEAKSSHTTNCSQTVSWGSSPPEPDAGTRPTQTHHWPPQAAVPLVPAHISCPPWPSWAERCVYDQINLPVTGTDCTQPRKGVQSVSSPEVSCMVDGGHTHTHRFWKITSALRKQILHPANGLPWWLRQ